jgi:hypothetical protein
VEDPEIRTSVDVMKVEEGDCNEKFWVVVKRKEGMRSVCYIFFMGYVY